MPASRELMALIQQYRRGAYTTKPDDPNYNNHWYSAPSGGDQILGSVPGTVVAQTPVGRVKQQANFRYSANNIYIDTPAVSAVGPVARFAQRGLSAAHLDQPMVAPLPAATPSFDVPFTVQTQVGQVEIRPNPSVHVGRPADLSPKQQVQNLVHLLRGR